MVKKTILKELYLPDDKVKEAKHDLMVLYDPHSLCYNDGYYAKSLTDKYGMSISDLELLVGKPKMVVKWEWD